MERLTMNPPNYSEDSFWDKVEKVAEMAAKIAKGILSKAFVLYYAAKDEETPEWASVVAFSALAYFVMPIDVIPDFLPIGFSDDISVLAGAIVTIAMHVKRKHRKHADEKMDELFGPDDPDDDPGTLSDSDDKPPQITA